MTAVGICILFALQKRFEFKFIRSVPVPVEKLDIIRGRAGCHLIFKYFYTGDTSMQCCVSGSGY
jgi:hypothetical protein